MEQKPIDVVAFLKAWSVSKTRIANVVNTAKRLQDIVRKQYENLDIEFSNEQQKYLSNQILSIDQLQIGSFYYICDSEVDLQFKVKLLAITIIESVTFLKVDWGQTKTSKFVTTNQLGIEPYPDGKWITRLHMIPAPTVNLKQSPVIKPEDQDLYDIRSHEFPDITDQVIDDIFAEAEQQLLQEEESGFNNPVERHLDFVDHQPYYCDDQIRYITDLKKGSNYFLYGKESGVSGKQLTKFRYEGGSLENDRFMLSFYEYDSGKTLVSDACWYGIEPFENGMWEADVYLVPEKHNEELSNVE